MYIGTSILFIHKSHEISKNAYHYTSYYYIRLYLERLLEKLNTPVRYWISYTFLNLFICLTIKVYVQQCTSF